MGYDMIAMYASGPFDIALTASALAVVGIFVVAITAIWTHDLRRRRRDLRRIGEHFAAAVSRASDEIVRATEQPPSRESSSNPLGKRRVPR